ncbi:MAG TPA: UDP-3-O-(3-hydroxymyristoyl)glucosamine N-acyltransferase [candidate division Zixibacteria bacterium]|nr:UDP-3-O-(3-hydroxymyristoyl)glucosamine N-acyltransferase [candidate division Zixibacteria bacterium]
MRASEIAKTLTDCEFLGPDDPEISAVSGIAEAGSADIAFLHNRSYKKFLAETGAGCVVMRREDIPESRDFAVIVSSNPHLSMAQTVKLLYPELLPAPSISSDARIHPSAKIGKGASIGAFSAIGEKTCIGDGTIVAENVTIGADVTIGARCRLYPGVTIYPKTTIGNDCIIHAGTVLGSDGFGFAPSPDGILKVIQVGRTVIEDEVEIGANSAVDRGSFGETRIGRGTKIDNLVQVGHNCRIGKYCLIAAQTGLAGSTVLGDRVMVGGQVGFAGHQTIGDGSTILAKSGVAGEIPPKSKLFGIPAKPSREAHRDVLLISRLDELFKRLRQLEKLLEEK